VSDQLQVQAAVLPGIKYPVPIEQPHSWPRRFGEDSSCLLPHSNPDSSVVKPDA
jgi:hypothetical protein